MNGATRDDSFDFIVCSDLSSVGTKSEEHLLHLFLILIKQSFSDLILVLQLVLISNALHTEGSITRYVSMGAVSLASDMLLLYYKRQSLFCLHVLGASDPS